MRAETSNGVSALIRDPRELPHPSLWEDTVRRQLFMNQDVCPHQTLNLPTP